MGSRCYEQKRARHNWKKESVRMPAERSLKMFKKLLSRIKKKKDSRLRPETNKSDRQNNDACPYTEEEARKVQERLQGLGYID